MSAPQQLAVVVLKCSNGDCGCAAAQTLAVAPSRALRQQSLACQSPDTAAKRLIKLEGSASGNQNQIRPY